MNSRCSGEFPEAPAFMLILTNIYIRLQKITNIPKITCILYITLLIFKYSVNIDIVVCFKEEKRSADSFCRAYFLHTFIIHIPVNLRIDTNIKFSEKVEKI